MVTCTNSSSLAPLPPDALSSGNTPPRNVVEDMYSLVMTLWQMGGQGKNINNGLLMTMIAKEINKLDQDLRAETTLDPASKIIYEGLSNCTILGSTLAGVCNDVATNNALSGYDAEILGKFASEGYLNQLACAITSVYPPTSGPFNMSPSPVSGQNWFAANGLSNDYKAYRTTDGTDLTALLTELQTLMTDIKNGNWANVVTDIGKLDTDANATWTDGGDGYISVIKDLIETPVPEFLNKSLKTIASDSNAAAELQELFTDAPSGYQSFFNSILSTFQGWETPS